MTLHDYVRHNCWSVTNRVEGRIHAYNMALVKVSAKNIDLKAINLLQFGLLRFMVDKITV